MCPLVHHLALLITALQLCASGLVSVPECNVRSTVFLKHRSNFNAHCAVESYTWSTILKSADPLDAFDRPIGEVIGWLVPTTVFHSRYGDKQWFDATCMGTYDVKQTAYRAWCRACSVYHWGRIVHALPEAQRVYGAAKELHNERTRNTLYSTCLHKWWETQKGSILGVKPSILGVKPSIFLSAILGVKTSWVWLWLLLKKPLSWALSLTASSVVSNLSLLCLISLSLVLFFGLLWPGAVTVVSYSYWNQLV